MPNGMRITPAGAGKTDAVYGKYLYVEDHPRRCGENCYTSVIYSIVKGSPPQVRGKRLNLKACRIKRGITPAGAGKTPVEHNTF